MISLYNDDCLNVLPKLNCSNMIIVTDPPFNIGYHYKSYKDKMPEANYYEMLKKIMDYAPSVIIHYPERLHQLSIYI